MTLNAAGQSSGTFTANTTAFQAGTVSAQISAALGDTVIATLTVNAASSCTPTTCATQGNNCGSISDGCCGTLTCGTCSSPQTCGGGRVAKVCGGTSSTATLSLSVTGRSGTVASTPSGLNVSSGNTASANFNVGTAITLQSNDWHGVIWSGLCSSGGQAAKTCSFTLKPTGSEMANLAVKPMVNSRTFAVFLIGAVQFANARSDGIPNDLAQAILNELRQIRILLERQQQKQQQTALTAPVAIPERAKVSEPRPAA